jgi:hypothetical protein
MACAIASTDFEPYRYPEPWHDDHRPFMVQRWVRSGVRVDCSRTTGDLRHRPLPRRRRPLGSPADSSVTGRGMVDR